MSLKSNINKYLDFSLSEKAANKLLDVTLNKGRGKVDNRSAIDPDLYYIVDLSSDIPKLVENASYTSRLEANKFAENRSVRKGSVLLSEYPNVFKLR